MRSGRSAAICSVTFGCIPARGGSTRITSGWPCSSTKSGVNSFSMSPATNVQLSTPFLTTLARAFSTAASDELHADDALDLVGDVHRDRAGAAVKVVDEIVRLEVRHLRRDGIEPLGLDACWSGRTRSARSRTCARRCGRGRRPEPNTTTSFSPKDVCATPLLIVLTSVRDGRETRTGATTRTPPSSRRSRGSSRGSPSAPRCGRACG